MDGRMIENLIFSDCISHKEKNNIVCLDCVIKNQCGSHCLKLSTWGVRLLIDPKQEMSEVEISSCKFNEKLRKTLKNTKLLKTIKRKHWGKTHIRTHR